MATEIRRYSGKLGDVIVTMYDKDEIVYRVKHHGLNISEWFPEWKKAAAISYAQFLAAKY